MGKTKGKAKRSGARQVKDLPVKNAKGVKGGSALDEPMQLENQEVSMISNIMKTKHETVKNTLNNVR